MTEQLKDSKKNIYRICIDMRIQSGTIIPNYNSQPTFKSWSRDVISINKKTLIKDIVHRNDTPFLGMGNFGFSL